MAKELTADDLMPLIEKLSVEERRRLLRFALTRGDDDSQAYADEPVRDGEFTSDIDPLAWDADGWEGIG
jgi:hypothetical protein